MQFFANQQPHVTYWTSSGATKLLKYGQNTPQNHASCTFYRVLSWAMHAKPVSCLSYSADPTNTTANTAHSVLLGFTAHFTRPAALKELAASIMSIMGPVWAPNPHWTTTARPDFWTAGSHLRPQVRIMCGRRASPEGSEVYSSYYSTNLYNNYSHTNPTVYDHCMMDPQGLGCRITPCILIPAPNMN